jgi:hypothetical protein
MCRNKCGNKSAKFSHVENKLINCISEYLKKNKLELKANKNSTKNSFDYSTINSNLEKELEKLLTQKTRLHDLLEQGIYDTTTFLDRQKDIIERQESIKQQITNLSILEKQNNKIITLESLNKIEKILQAYKSTRDPKEKNSLLKSILYKAIYFKAKQNREDNFTLDIFPKI